MFFVEVDWDKPNLPRHVGPFNTREEATEWGHLNIRNGGWMVCPLADPYWRGAGHPWSLTQGRQRVG